MNKVSIKFKKNIYKKPAIENAIQSFVALADFKINQAGSYFVVEIKPKEEIDKDDLVDEFGNHVLYFMKSL